MCIYISALKYNLTSVQLWYLRQILSINNVKLRKIIVFISHTHEISFFRACYNNAKTLIITIQSVEIEL